MKTKYVLAFCNLLLKIDLNCVTRFKNRFNIMLILILCVLIYSVTKCVFEDVLNTAVL